MKPLLSNPKRNVLGPVKVVKREKKVVSLDKVGVLLLQANLVVVREGKVISIDSTVPL